MKIKKSQLKIVLLISIIIFVIAFSEKDKLPDRKDILEQLYSEPVQTETSLAPFQIKKKRIVYDITPLYNYSLYGLVVSYFHAHSFLDLWHEKAKDFINLKDICVIWGENISNEIYRLMKFSNDDTSCCPKFRSGTSWETTKKYNEDFLSNNHLLIDNEAIRDTVMSTEKGDQIYIKGYLVQYTHSEWKGFKRGSSISRTDRGNGACEVIYVTDFKILKKANYLWRLIYRVTKYLILTSLIGLIIIWFKDPAFSNQW